MTPEKAVDHGARTVNRAVFFCILGLPAIIAGFAYLISRSTPVAYASGGLALVPCWFLAWTMWSLLVPRWRIWAYERVDDLGALKQIAVERKLLWPDGHWFEKTEIRSRAQRRRIAELENAWRERDGQ